ncbi:hypothetical protein ZIOFF_031119 [Zingiber officinale]|uniref:Adaptor AP-1 19 kDa protein n=2 Tax=Zingiber officinale TaxID=94328 RepID=A0A8J5H0R0_ZINOF|nr:hypothetical protein ZIOFF_031119 [Zingiber officinale]
MPALQPSGGPVPSALDGLEANRAGNADGVLAFFSFLDRLLSVHHRMPGPRSKNKETRSEIHKLLPCGRTLDFDRHKNAQFSSSPLAIKTAMIHTVKRRRQVAPPSPFAKLRPSSSFPAQRRRLEESFPSFLLPAASIWDFLTGGIAAAQEASVSVRRGMPLFRQIHFVLLISRQGKVRLTKWYSPYSQKERTKAIRELSGLILPRGPKLCNFVEWRGYKVVYRRYASLYFCMCIDAEDNELEILEIIHHFVEILDRYFGSVCELDLIFNFHKAYYILDEILIAGELQESSKKAVARLIAAQDQLVEAAKEQASSISNMIAQATK